MATQGGFGVALDGRVLKLPGGAPLACGTRRLAEAVAEEWSAAGGGEHGAFDPNHLLLTRLAGTMQHDLEADRDHLASGLLRFASSDLLCYRAAIPEALAAMQAERWQPWLDWAMDRHDAALLVTHGVMPLVQPELALACLRRALRGLSRAGLTGLGLAVPRLGSLVLGLALAERRLGADEAVALSLLDESFQSECWGLDAELEARAARLRAEVGTAARWFELADG